MPPMTTDPRPAPRPSASPAPSRSVPTFPRVPSTQVPPTRFADAPAHVRDSLHGLAAGDAFGAQFFVPELAAGLRRRQLPPTPWPWTDDTEMAASVVDVLLRHGTVDGPVLLGAFAARHDFDRGYGPAMNRMLRLVREGGDGPALAAALFDGQGSWGNGAAMRVAPLGAWFRDEPLRAAAEAARSARVTHTHPDAVAGAVAVAVAAAYAARRDERRPPVALLEAVAALVPSGPVHTGLAEAAALLAAARPACPGTGVPPGTEAGTDTDTEADADADAEEARLAARLLGNGSRVSAVDTVPFALWCAARHLDDYAAALWACSAAGGDVDTTCAIVGGVVAARTGYQSVPAAWRAAIEPLPRWLSHGRGPRRGDDDGPAHDRVAW